jgi:hypothetical protein
MHNFTRKSFFNPDDPIFLNQEKLVPKFFLKIISSEIPPPPQILLSAPTKRKFFGKETESKPTNLRIS